MLPKGRILIVLPTSWLFLGVKVFTSGKHLPLFCDGLPPIFVQISNVPKGLFLNTLIINWHESLLASQVSTIPMKYLYSDSIVSSRWIPMTLVVGWRFIFYSLNVLPCAFDCMCSICTCKTNFCLKTWVEPLTLPPGGRGFLYKNTSAVFDGQNKSLWRYSWCQEDEFCWLVKPLTFLLGQWFQSGGGKTLKRRS